MAHQTKSRPLRALQIEVTSRCTRSCRICPRSDLSHVWRDGDLSMELWKSVVPDLRLAEHIHLQGWGEPLLHPMLPEWAAEAHEAGCSVGITTNGDMLSEAIPWLLEGNVNLITLSVAGDYGSHAEMRDGSNLSQLMENAFELIQRLRERKLYLKVQLSYLLTRTNACELPETVRLAADTGLDEAFVIHLDCRTSKFHMEQSACNDEFILHDVEPYLKEVRRIVRWKRFRFREPSRKQAEVLACALNPMYFTFITWDGRVGPCTYLLLPISGQIPRYTVRGMRYVKPVSYGTIGRATLSHLLISEVRKKYIEAFRVRLEAERKFLNQIDMEASIQTLRKIELASVEREKTLAINPLPDQCEDCPKAWGW